MSLKDLHVGGWYRCRDPKFLANVVGKVFNNTYPYAVVLYCDGDYENSAAFSLEGRYSLDLESHFDLIEHLPECTGPDWKPKKWRKATVQDAVSGKQCRVTLDERTFESNISGFKRDARYLYFYIMCQGQCKYWYDSDCVEVLDD